MAKKSPAKTSKFIQQKSPTRFCRRAGPIIRGRSATPTLENATSKKCTFENYALGPQNHYFYSVSSVRGVPPNRQFLLATFFAGSGGFRNKSREKRVYATTVGPLFSRSVARPRGHSKKSYGVCPFPGKQGKRVYTIGPERRVYTIEPQTQKKKKKGGSPPWWCIFFPFPVNFVSRNALQCSLIFKELPGTVLGNSFLIQVLVLFGPFALRTTLGMSWGQTQIF